MSFTTRLFMFHNIEYHSALITKKEKKTASCPLRLETMLVRAVRLNQSSKADEQKDIKTLKVEEKVSQVMTGLKRLILFKTLWWSTTGKILYCDAQLFRTKILMILSHHFHISQNMQYILIVIETLNL